MNLAILHYHLNRGGVTQVIANHLRALDAVLDPAGPWRVALIYGGRREGWSDDLPEKLRSIRLTLCEVPCLDYDDVQEDPGCRPNDLHGQLVSVLDRLRFDPDETVLHIHNHSLGKNRCLAETVPRLARDGYALFLQVHDFAEDFRPANYRLVHDRLSSHGPESGSPGLYPQASNIHYAVLNGRDFHILRHSGTEAARLHLLPNPVPEVDELPPRHRARARLAELFGVGSEQCFVLYPVRCIRRKNVGEALLLGAVAPRDTVVGLTLAPLNPAETPVYTTWKDLATGLKLPCRFEVGAPGRLTFFENLAAADLILTTSLAEGFGMVFLESWLADRPLIGRDLPEITPDFTKVGVRFGWLRPQLWVPLDWVGAEIFGRTVAEAYRRTLAAYNRAGPSDWDRVLDDKIESGLVDFGDLDEPMQRQVIRTVASEGKNGCRIIECNPWLEEALAVRPATASEVIRANVRVIREHFSLLPSGRRLLESYGRAVSSPRGDQPVPLPAPGRILDHFLDLKRFRLIRS